MDTAEKTTDYLKSLMLNPQTANLIEKAGLQTNHFAVKYYVKEPIFRSYLWNKLILNTLGVNHLRNYFKYLYEILEITVNYRSYKSNFFAFLKK